MTQSRNIAKVASQCVACGCCVAVCPKRALHIDAGVIARLDEERCVGCGKCVKICPAAVIQLVERGGVR